MSQNCNPRGRAGGAVLDGAAMKLYGSTNNKSFNTLKIRFALAEIGAPYEFVPGRSRQGRVAHARLHAPQPARQGAGAGGRRLRAARVGRDPLVPGREVSRREPAAPAGRRRRRLQARAQILRFLGIASTAFYPAYSDWWNATNSDDPAKRSPDAADSALVKVKRALDVLEKTLASGEHLVGGFSLADVANVSILFSLKRRLQIDPIAGHERVRAWYQRVTARPTWQSVASD